MLMVGVELGFNWVYDKCESLLGKQDVKDPEDPAAMVGTFKRYK